MKVFAVLAHERQSFDGAVFRTAIETFGAGGHEVRTSDLHAMHVDPVSDGTISSPSRVRTVFKQQIEEMHAFAERGSLARRSTVLQHRE
jgi:NAD(P)H dehydrogenase (quinone)